MVAATAIGISPDKAGSSIALRTVVENVTPALIEERPLLAQEYVVQDRVQRGETLASLLARLNVADPEALDFIRRDKAARGLYQLVPGHIVKLSRNDSGDLLALSYLKDNGTLLKLVRNGDDFRASEETPDLQRRLVFKSGTIRSSLYAATDAAGIPDSVANQVAKLFATDIDFREDLRKGDRFAVVYEVFAHGGDVVKTGKILAADFENQGETYRVVYYQPEGAAEGEYYTAGGESLRKAFLRSPLEFSRVTSGFSAYRFHPILQNWRAHKGVDFAAPTGTPVLATADGAVQFLGRQNGYGNVIELRHHQQYGTLYGHLSRMAEGLSVGDQVKQGEVIGYVGMTGLATGPHLHYEFRIAGVHNDPLGDALPVAFPVSAQFKARFDAATGSLLSGLELARGANLALFE